MDKVDNKETKNAYVPPRILKEVVFEGGVAILQGSTVVRPGGGGGGSISVENPLHDPTNDQIVGTAKSDFHFEWQ